MLKTFDAAWRRIPFHQSIASTGWQQVLQCHGALGSLNNGNMVNMTGVSVDGYTFANPTNMFGLDYGGDLKNLRRSKTVPNIVPVDFTKEGHQPTYRRANQLLSKAANVVIIGLSEVGCREAQLKFAEHSTVYCHGNAPVIQGAIPSGGYALTMAQQLCE